MHLEMTQKGHIIVGDNRKLLMVPYAKPNPVSAMSKTWIYGRLLVGISGWNQGAKIDVCLF